MAFQIRRGTNAQRLTIIPLQGELIFTTDTKALYVGDGTTAGGVAVGSGGGAAPSGPSNDYGLFGDEDYGSFATPAGDEDYGTF